MKKINKNTAKKYIYETNGKFFSAVFVKMNGEKRPITCRTKVHKYVKGVGLSFKPQDKGYMVVFDLHKGAYRFLNLNTLESLKIGGKEYEVI
tara:strand:- start:127 stop:402 length:276 start_codon:yes stop_codon:yes gene_type:complete